MCNARHLQSCKDHAIAGTCTTADTVRNLIALPVAVLLTMFSRRSPSTVAHTMVQRQFSQVARNRYLVRHAVECCSSCKRVAACICRPAPVGILPVHDVDYPPRLRQNLHVVMPTQSALPAATPISHTFIISAASFSARPQHIPCSLPNLLAGRTAQTGASPKHLPALESLWPPPGAVRSGRPPCRPAAAAT